MKPLTAVLGCGPSGLLAALALEQRGVPFVIFSKKEKSLLGGAQYSHIQIPMEWTDADSQPDVMLTYVIRGDAETYQRKVYGAEPVPFVSMEGRKDGEQVPAWNLIKLYDRLWDRYEGQITTTSVDARRASRIPATFDLVFSSIPAHAICMATVDPNINHGFKSQPVRIYNEALDPSTPDNTIIYDGTDEHSYYRMSRIFGVGSTEWGGSSPLPPIKPLRTVNKPISTNCDCHPDIVRIGRFGTWQKGILTFHAYNAVIDVLSSMGVE